MLPRLSQQMLVMLALVACGVAPRPERADASILPRRALDAAAAGELAILVDRATAAVSQLRYEEAATAARDALNIDPRSARARAVLAMLAMKSAMASEPPDSEAMLGGEVQMRLAQQLAPEDPFVGWMNAVFLAESGHLSAAAAAAEQALQGASTASALARAALLGIAGAYRYELGEERAAVPHLQKYVALRPDDSTARFQLGASLLRLATAPQGIPPTSLLVGQRHAEDAARAFVRCLELSPQDDAVALAAVAAYLRAAELAVERSRWAQDRDDERRNLDAERDGNRQAADAMLRQALERFPNSAAVQFEAGVIAEAAADPARARACYQRAIAADPVHLPSLLNLAELLARSGERAAAADLLRQVLDAPESRRELTTEERKRIEDWLRSS